MSNPNEEPLYIHHHLGLGDHLDCNGMVRHILKHSEHDNVAVFAKSNYFSMIDYMYRDDDHIKVLKVSKEDEYGDVDKIIRENKAENFLKIGHEYYPGRQAELSQNKNCWEFFYEQIDMPYSVRYDYFYVERDSAEEQRVYDKLNPDNEPFIFVHDDPERGFTLEHKHFLNQDLRIIMNDVTENIFHFTKIIEEAEEIHCMESSFKTLIDFYAKQDNIFYHDFRHHPLGQNSLDRWKVIKY